MQEKKKNNSGRKQAGIGRKKDIELFNYNSGTTNRIFIEVLTFLARCRGISSLVMEYKQLCSGG